MIYIQPPDVETRREIFRIHLKKIPHDDQVTSDSLAALTEGYSGAEIAALCREGVYVCASKYLIALTSCIVLTQECIMLIIFTQYHAAALSAMRRDPEAADCVLFHVRTSLLLLCMAKTCLVGFQAGHAQHHTTHYSRGPALLRGVQLHPCLRGSACELLTMTGKTDEM